MGTDTTRFAAFETAVGWCGVGWRGPAVVGVRLPEGDRARMLARLRGVYPLGTEGDPPPPIRSAIDAMVALLAGQPADLGRVLLDLSGLPEFARLVYERARQIPPGATVTYGELARRIGAPGAARSVGQALGRNPVPIIVPCHRVVAADGRPGGFSAPGGVSVKQRMLAIESVASAQPPLLTDVFPSPPGNR
jgi:methylated-DNA-[protein]-cysteine S-methyltransferase